jgi:hypothetical protein
MPAPVTTAAARALEADGLIKHYGQVKAAVSDGRKRRLSYEADI